MIISWCFPECKRNRRNAKLHVDGNAEIRRKIKKIYISTRILFGIYWVSFMSKTLMRTRTAAGYSAGRNKFTFGQPEREKNRLKRCILLHGIFGNETDWVHGTRIQKKMGRGEKPCRCHARPARMRFMWISRPSVPCGWFIGERTGQLQEKCFRCQKKKTPLWRRHFPWWFWRSKESAEISRYLQGCDLPVRCTSCAGKSEESRADSFAHERKVIFKSGQAAKSDKNHGCFLSAS